MSKRVSVGIRISTDGLAAVDRYAARNGLDRSAAIRALLTYALLTIERPPAPPVDQQELPGIRPTVLPNVAACATFKPSGRNQLRCVCGSPLRAHVTVK